MEFEESNGGLVENEHTLWAKQETVTRPKVIITRRVCSIHSANGSSNASQWLSKGSWSHSQDIRPSGGINSPPYGSSYFGSCRNCRRVTSFCFLIVDLHASSDVDRVIASGSGVLDAHLALRPTGSTPVTAGGPYGWPSRGYTTKSNFLVRAEVKVRASKKIDGVFCMNAAPVAK